MSNVGADILRQGPIWMMDGTFKVVPKSFYQVKYIQYLSGLPVQYFILYTNSTVHIHLYMNSPDLTYYMYYLSSLIVVLKNTTEVSD
jgi:hypothetical protein